MNKTITQEEIEKAAVEYAASLSECGMYDKETPATKEDIEYAFKAGVKFALGKQEKDGIDLKKLDKMLDDALEKETKESLNQWLSEKDAGTVISGWAARDEDGHLFMYCTKPERNEALQVWMGRYANFDLRDYLFPDLTWEDDPIEVELIIKIKKR